ncbi:hypothetical protein K461DRAFT_311850 [Myriangium duriaei CBS 260.36]|uniref:DNA-directed RNA polymerase III subunit n=1 Tax=Myriangium duriaei CBS 260.36 TaxID=1168546 RepID=A0A9P4J5F4_9PEZI|nr:hypothetical protein K461DRAFT_311850 [Myriangium duriaei CBS 260.36]
MSRGGRGGFRGGKGGLDSRLGLDYDQSLDLLTDTKPSALFPPIPPPIAEPPSHAERLAVHHYRTLRARIHDGAFYCILDPSARVTKSSSRQTAAAFFNAFDSQPTYTQKFRKARNALPNLTKRPFVRELFPQELWGTMGVEGTEADAKVGKKLEISQRTRLDKWMKNTEEEGEEGDGEEEDKGDDEEEEVEKVAEEGEEEADPDQFDEDDEDENDDYNAEQYFSGGEDDDYGDDGGGGGDDDY